MRDFSHLNDVQMADAIMTLAGRLAAGEAEQLELIGEFDARQAWAGPGLLSCAHWLTWRTGMSPNAARERVRVARSLPASDHEVLAPVRCPSRTVGCCPSQDASSQFRGTCSSATPSQHPGRRWIRAQILSSRGRDAVRRSKSSAATSCSVTTVQASSAALLAVLLPVARRLVRLVRSVRSLVVASLVDDVRGNGGGLRLGDAAC